MENSSILCGSDVIAFQQMSKKQIILTYYDGAVHYIYVDENLRILKKDLIEKEEEDDEVFLSIYCKGGSEVYLGGSKGSILKLVIEQRNQSIINPTDIRHTQTVLHKFSSLITRKPVNQENLDSILLNGIINIGMIEVNKTEYLVCLNCKDELHWFQLNTKKFAHQMQFSLGHPISEAQFFLHLQVNQAQSSQQVLYLALAAQNGIFVYSEMQLIELFTNRILTEERQQSDVLIQFDQDSQILLPSSCIRGLNINFEFTYLAVGCEDSSLYIYKIQFNQGKVELNLDFSCQTNSTGCDNTSISNIDFYYNEKSCYLIFSFENEIRYYSLNDYQKAIMIKQNKKLDKIYFINFPQSTQSYFISSESKNNNFYIKANQAKIF